MSEMLSTRESRRLRKLGTRRHSRARRSVMAAGDERWRHASVLYDSGTTYGPYRPPQGRVLNATPGQCPRSPEFRDTKVCHGCPKLSSGVPSEPLAWEAAERAKRLGDWSQQTVPSEDDVIADITQPSREVRGDDALASPTIFQPWHFGLLLGAASVLGTGAWFGWRAL